VAVPGVYSEGLITTAHPAAMAAAHFQAMNNKGELVAINFVDITWVDTI
jgi:hypothetical protein